MSFISRLTIVTVNRDRHRLRRFREPSGGLALPFFFFFFFFFFFVIPFDIRNPIDCLSQSRNGGISATEIASGSLVATNARHGTAPSSRLPSTVVVSGGDASAGLSSAVLARHNRRDRALDLELGLSSVATGSAGDGRRVAGDNDDDIVSLGGLTGAFRVPVDDQMRSISLTDLSASVRQPVR